MSIQNLVAFWNKNRKKIGSALPKGINELARILQPGADETGFIQKKQDESILWATQEGKLEILFCRFADPWNIDHVLNIYTQVKKNPPSLTAVLVHQWTDEEGNWDVFAIIKGTDHTMYF